MILSLLRTAVYIYNYQPPMLSGTATRYDYTLNIWWNQVEWSKTHRTCALRIKERYGTYRVCSIDTWKCVDCYHNDYWPEKRTNKIIDLSSYAFKQLGIPLSRWVAKVKIRKLNDDWTILYQNKRNDEKNRIIWILGWVLSKRWMNANT